MSDLYVSIVPLISDYPNRIEKANEILQMLFNKDIVKRELSDCILGKDLGYAISNGALAVVDKNDNLPFDELCNGLEVITEMYSFNPGEYFDFELDDESQCFESNLGFTFWNWMYLKEDFIQEFKNILECDVLVIEGHI